MEFKLNRNNKILEVTICKESDAGGTEIQLGSVELNQAYISDMEEILNGKKSPNGDDCLMIEKIVVSEEDYSYFRPSAVYGLKASALSLAGRNIYCFDLYFEKLVLEKIGNKKKDGNNMILKNVKMRYLEGAVYSAKEVSGLTGEGTEDVAVSVVNGDKIASVTL